MASLLHNAGVVCIALLVVGMMTQVAAQNPGRVSFWNWRESVADPADSACSRDFNVFMNGPDTQSLLRGSNMYLSTSHMWLCNSTQDLVRKANLPTFIKEQYRYYESSTDLLFGQASDNKNSAGIGLWVEAAVDFINSLGKGERVPALRFDVEYEPTAADAVRVLNMANWVRTYLDSTYPHGNRPHISWAVNFAAMLQQPTSMVRCPAAEAANATMLIGECFFYIVDSVDLMDFRSYAVQAPKAGACDGAVLFAAPFFESAARHGKKVTIGFETDCGLGQYTYKISFCGPQQAFHTSQPLEYMYDTMTDTQRFLQNTTAALEEYPCSAKAQGVLQPLVKGQDYWGAVNDPAFIVEDMFGWAYLAYNGTKYVPLNCPGNDYAWSTCMDQAAAAKSPSAHLGSW